MELTTNAQHIWAHFNQLPGSRHIASEHAIRGLVKWLIQRKPKVILEVGAGIGTLTFAAVAALTKAHETSDYRLVSIENNEFCETALRKNLEAQWGQFDLIREFSEPRRESLAPFDFVIIDGGNQNPDFVSNLSPRAVIFIEGFMDKKHRLIADTHKQRRWLSTNFRSLDRKASYWIFQFEPTLVEVAWFTVNNLYNRIYSGLQRRLSRSRLSEKEA